MEGIKARLRGGSLSERYFDWMVGLVHGPVINGRSYKILFKTLDRTKFEYVMDRDGNRAVDGIDLRYRFGYEYDIPKSEIQEELDNRDCSVLEMMVALAHRCEEDIMTVDEEGDRTGVWFAEMLESLELDLYDDRHWNPEEVTDILENFQRRKYAKNGHGGLFTLHTQPRMDMRKVEIWLQMMAWLIEKDEGGKL